MTSYFIITSGEDGISIEGPLSNGEVTERITPDSAGYTYYGKIDGFHEAVPKQDSGCFMESGKKLLIIKGEVIVPKAESVVTRYKL